MGEIEGDRGDDGDLRSGSASDPRSSMATEGRINSGDEDDSDQTTQVGRKLSITTQRGYYRPARTGACDAKSRRDDDDNIAGGDCVVPFTCPW